MGQRTSIDVTSGRDTLMDNDVITINETSQFTALQHRPAQVSVKFTSFYIEGAQEVKYRRVAEFDRVTMGTGKSRDKTGNTGNVATFHHV